MARKKKYEYALDKWWAKNQDRKFKTWTEALEECAKAMWDAGRKELRKELKDK